MSETTFDPLTDSMRELLIKGDDVTLSPYSNCIRGTVAFDVHGLVRRGLWVKKREHVADMPHFSYSVYGPPSIQKV